MGSSFGGCQSRLASKVASNIYYPYPQPLASYEEVVANSKLLMETLVKLHATLGTKFMIPIMGGKELDLHRLFVEVTSRGGIEKVLNEKKWKEVTATFRFPCTATNASFVLRKYYFSLLLHYEQIYFFKAQGWKPLAHADGLAETPPDIHTLTPQSLRANTTESVPRARASAASVGCSVVGVIDGKFKSGYLVTVTLGTETLKGVLYLSRPNPVQGVPEKSSIFGNGSGINPAATAIQRRRRRKKSEMRKRDPDRPKPNRSGYNFFFQEQHARLKLLYSGKDRKISKMIGELWTKLKDSERTVYQEKALADKERYRLEMENYRRSRMSCSEVISDAMPLQQRLPILLPAQMVGENMKDDNLGTSEDEDECCSSRSEMADGGTEGSNVEITDDAEMDGGSREVSGEKSSIPAGEMTEDSVPVIERQNSSTPMS